MPGDIHNSISNLIASDIINNPSSQYHSHAINSTKDQRERSCRITYMVSEQTVTKQRTMTGGTQSKTINVIQESTCLSCRMTYNDRTIHHNNIFDLHSCSQGGKILRSPDTVMCQKSSVRQILKFVIFPALDLTSHKISRTVYTHNATVFWEIAHQRMNNAFLGQLKKSHFSSHLLICSENPRLLACRQTKWILYHGPKRYYDETKWPWVKNHIPRHGLKR